MRISGRLFAIFLVSFLMERKGEQRSLLGQAVLISDVSLNYLPGLHDNLF